MSVIKGHIPTFYNAICNFMTYCRKHPWRVALIVLGLLTVLFIAVITGLIVLVKIADLNGTPASLGSPNWQ